jgi:solute carrier family 25 phosphate transporter 23/24/25/41
MPESHAPESAIDNPQGQHSDDLLIPPNRPFIPRLRSDAISHPHTLEEFREAEGRENRKRMLLELWKSLPEVLQPFNPESSKPARSSSISSAEAESLKATYDNELLLHCAGPSGSRPRHIEWSEFKNYAEAKETGKS